MYAADDDLDMGGWEGLLRKRKAFAKAERREICIAPREFQHTAPT
jgi:hypothetical protein